MRAGQPPKIAVIGLGYVGLPLAVALARHFPVTGYDVNPARIAELRDGRDRTGELEPSVLRASACRFSASVEDLANSHVFIITVPTPVDSSSHPDLSAVRSACASIGKVMSHGAIVVLESTVSPGVTEEVCGPDLEAASGLVCGRDFFLGYSPERINPGDREHTIDRITKVIAGQTPEVTETLRRIYGAITTGGVFVARNIKTAEAAKVIENAQRDINIAFINEVSMIFGQAGISIHDVLEASATKWNFLRFSPGLVGGHCIGVDPFYLAEFAKRLGHHPEIILAGRRINDGMGDYIADRIARILGEGGAAGEAVLILGLTFKENVPDLRNSKVMDLIEGLRRRGYDPVVHDPHADPEEAKQTYGLTLLSSLLNIGPFAAVIGAVAHDFYKSIGPENLVRLVQPGGLIADLKGLWRNQVLPEGIRRWEL